MNPVRNRGHVLIWGWSDEVGVINHGQIGFGHIVFASYF